MHVREQTYFAQGHTANSQDRADAAALLAAPACQSAWTRDKARSQAGGCARFTSSLVESDVKIVITRAVCSRAEDRVVLESALS